MCVTTKAELHKIAQDEQTPRTSFRNKRHELPSQKNLVLSFAEGIRVISFRCIDDLLPGLCIARACDIKVFCDHRAHIQTMHEGPAVASRCGFVSSNIHDLFSLFLHSPHAVKQDRSRCLDQRLLRFPEAKVCTAQGPCKATFEATATVSCLWTNMFISVLTQSLVTHSFATHGSSRLRLPSRCRRTLECVHPVVVSSYESTG